MAHWTFECPHDQPTVYEWGLQTDQEATVERDGRPTKTRVWFGLVLDRDEVRFVRRLTPRWTGQPRQVVEPLASCTHAAFLADSEPIRAIARRWLDPNQWSRAFSGARHILHKARDEGGWRSHMHINATLEHVRQVDAALRYLKQSGRRIHEPLYEGESELWWDAEAKVFHKHTRGDNPYSGETRESHLTPSESEVRARFLRMSAADFDRLL
jgi:hypothetical protein